MDLSGDIVGGVERLRFVLQKNDGEDGGFEKDMKYRIKRGWKKWRKASGILCDRRKPIRLKGNFIRY